MELIVIDSHPSAGDQHLEPSALVHEFLHDHAALSDAARVQHSAEDGLEAVWQAAVRDGVIRADELDDMRRGFAVFEANQGASARYAPSPSPVRVHWIRATATEQAVGMQVDRARAAWSRWALDGIVETTLEATHYSIIRGTAAAEVARAIKAARARFG